MNRFIIVDGLPYLYANNKAYKVRWNDEGFTVGAEVKLASVPAVTYSELSIKAKCANNLDSIAEAVQEDEQAQETEQEAEQEAVQEDEQAQIDFDSMTVAELKDYASKNDINLKGARTRDTIIEAIMAAKE